MTYEEYFQHCQEMHKTHSGRRLTDPDQYLDEEIALINQLPCTGRGVSSPVFRQHGVAIDVSSLDSGAELHPEFGCMHCTWLAAYKWKKAAIEAERNGNPLPPMP